MCEGCWEGYGSPNIVNEKTEAALVLVRQVYEAIGGSAGGHLHIVLDDWNLETGSIEWCLEQSGKRQGWGTKYDATPTTIERACGEALLDMTLAERASCLAKFDDYY